MTWIHAQALGFQYQTATYSLFQDVCFALGRDDRIGLVGENGCDKSTLLPLLVGEASPTQGRLWVHPKGRICMMRQNPVPDWTKIRAFGEVFVLDFVWNPDVCDEALARTVLGSLGLTGCDVDQAVVRLRPGQASRVRLARSLLKGANVLLLDEPTNHLDIKTRMMLADRLRAYTGAAILVSHDRWFRQQIVSKEYRLG